MCCLDLLCCCLGPAACGLCCGGCGGKANRSVLTRLLYLTFLVMIVLVSSILLAPDVQESLADTKLLCKDLKIEVNLSAPVINDPNVVSGTVGSLIDCNQFVGYIAVYRLCMGVASFFVAMMFIMLCVFSSKDPRAYIQNGFWCIKYLVVLAIVIAFFFIPTGDNLIFSKVSLGFGMVGSFFFIIIQVILLIDLAHRIAEFLLDRAEETENKCWYLPMLVATIVIYLASLTGISLLYAFFTELESCSLNKFFITSTLFFSVAVSIIAILPWVQRVQPKSGLLQAAVVSGYCTYQTWSAISTEPYGNDRDCHIKENNLAIFSDNGNALAASIIGILVLLITVGYVCFTLSSAKQLRKFRGGSKDEDEKALLGTENGSFLCCDCLPSDDKDDNSTGGDGDGDGDDEDKGKWRMSSNNDEEERVTYSYSFFHFLMIISVLYLMMQLTNWADPGEANSERFQNSWASVWVKMATVWVCFGVYVWTLIAPLVLGTCRDFDYAED